MAKQKRLSLYGVDLEDALRVALSTPIPPGQEKPKPVRKKKAAKKPPKGSITTKAPKL